MKLKQLTAASMLVLASVGSQAASYDWGVHGLLESGLSLTGGGLVYDTYKFSLTATSTVASSVSSLGTLVVPASYSLWAVGGDGLVGTVDDVATPYAWNFGGAPIVHSVTLGAGSYYYAVFANAPGVAAYSISSAATAAVPIPEPETYAMLLAGLGVVGFVARRRRGQV